MNAQGSQRMKTSRRIIGTVPQTTHRNSYEKEFQCKPVSIEKEGDVTSMYKKVSDLIMHTKPDVSLVQMSAKKGIENTWYACNTIRIERIYPI